MAHLAQFSFPNFKINLQQDSLSNFTKCFKVTTIAKFLK